MRAWQAGGSLDAFGRAKTRVQELLAVYRRPALASEVEQALVALVRREAQLFGLQDLPGVP